jgi:glycogen operon protein
MEGASDDPDIAALRRRQKRNLLATLLLSQGTPMLLGGDELGHSQSGNNNAYCQDNETTWLDWQEEPGHDPGLLEFIRRLIAFRRRHPVLRRAGFLHGRGMSPSGLKDVTWLAADGAEHSESHWTAPDMRCLGLMLCGAAVDPDQRHAPAESDDTLLVLLNADEGPVAFTLPDTPDDLLWQPEIDTTEPDLGPAGAPPLPAGAQYRLAGRTVAVLRGVSGAAGAEVPADGKAQPP